MKLFSLVVLSLLTLTACDKRIHEARFNGDQAITRSSVSQSGLTYSCPNN